MPWPWQKKAPPVDDAPTEPYRPPERGADDLAAFNVGDTVRAGRDRQDAVAKASATRKPLPEGFVVPRDTYGTVKGVDMHDIFVAFPVEVPREPWRHVRKGEGPDFSTGDRLKAVGPVPTAWGVIPANHVVNVLDDQGDTLRVALMLQFPKSDWVNTLEPDLRAWGSAEEDKKMNKTPYQAAKRDPLGPKEMGKWLSSEDPLAIFSAARGKSGRDDKRRMQMLARDLHELGVKPADMRRLRGQWFSETEERMRPEPSIAVRGLSFEDAMELSRKYDQDAFIFKDSTGVVAMYEGYRDSDEGPLTATVPSRDGEPLFGGDALISQPRAPKNERRAPPKEPPEELFSGSRSNTFEVAYDWADHRREVPLASRAPVTQDMVRDHFERQPEPEVAPNDAGDVPTATASAGSRRAQRRGAPQAARRGQLFDDLDESYDPEDAFDPEYELGGPGVTRMDDPVERARYEDVASGPDVPVTQRAPIDHDQFLTPEMDDAEDEFGFDQEHPGYPSDLGEVIKTQSTDHKFEDFLDRVHQGNRWPGASASPPAKRRYNERLKDNIRAVLEQADDDTIADYRSWYRDANAHASMIAERHDVPLDKVIGVIAAISPNTPWKANLMQADQLLSNPSRYEELYRERERLLQPFNDQIKEVTDQRDEVARRNPEVQRLNGQVEQAIEARKATKKGTPEYKKLNQRISALREERKKVIKADPERQKLDAEVFRIKETARDRVYKLTKSLGGPMYASNLYKALAIVDDESPGETGLNIARKGKNAYVTDVRTNSPAEEAGLQAGMRVLSVDGETTEGMTKKDFEKALLGPDNTTATIEIAEPLSAEEKEQKEHLLQQQSAVAENSKEWLALQKKIDRIGDTRKYQVKRRSIAIGPKVGDFQASIMDPAKMAENPTVDGHMINLARGTMDPLNEMESGLSEEERQAIKQAYREVSKEFMNEEGEPLTAQEAHAVAWVVWRSAIEKWDKQKKRSRPKPESRPPSRGISPEDEAEGEWMDNPEDWYEGDGRLVDPLLNRRRVGAVELAASRVPYLTEVYRSGEVELHDVRPGDHVKVFEGPGVEPGSMGQVRAVNAEAGTLSVDTRVSSKHAGGGVTVGRRTVHLPARNVALLLHSEDDRLP